MSGSDHTRFDLQFDAETRLHVGPDARREGQDVGAWTFLKLGLLVMPPALVLALAGLLLL